MDNRQVTYAFKQCQFHISAATATHRGTSYFQKLAIGA